MGAEDFCMAPGRGQAIAPTMMTMEQPEKVAQLYPGVIEMRLPDVVGLFLC